MRPRLRAFYARWAAMKEEALSKPLPDLSAAHRAIK